MKEGELEALKKRLEEAKKLYKKATTKEERIALAAYMRELSENMSELINLSRAQRLKFSINNRRQTHSCLSLFEELERRMTEGFIKHQDFHDEFHEGIIANETKLKKLYDEDKKSSELNEMDFHEIFMGFMKSLNLGSLYEKYLNEQRIHYINSPHVRLTHNPINKDSDIFIGQGGYNLDTLFHLAGFMGHGYDLSRFDGTADEYMQYAYASFYGQVISKLFQKLFLYYLIKNNILADEAKNKLAEMELYNNESAKSSLMLSVLDEDYLRNNAYKTMPRQKIVSDCLYDFYDEDAIIKYLLGFKDLDIRRDLTSSYGNIISQCMLDEVLASGLDVKELRELLKVRSQLFDPKFLEDNNITSDRYREANKKGLELIKN